MNFILFGAAKLDLGVRMLRSLCAWLCSFIYPLIAKFFEMFLAIAKLDILSSDYIQPIYQRVTMILTIVMIFYVTFELIKYVIEPDQFSDKEKGAGKIIYKMIAVVVLIAFVPKIFTMAYKVQNVIIENQVISKVILGKTNIDSASFGNNLSADLLSTFYSVSDNHNSEDCDGIPCGTLVNTNISTLRQNGELPYLTVGINTAIKNASTIENKKVVEPVIEFDAIYAIIVGIFVLYILLMYSIDLGARFAQMIFMQVIAPIPIMGYLAPKKDGIFEKWVKQCFITYIDLFIRLGIIYFILLICQIITSAYQGGNLFATAEGLGTGMQKFAYIILIMGLLLFAKKVPELLKELFPKTGAASGNFGLKAGERVAPMAARAIGAGLGSTRAIGGALAKAASTYKRNKYNGQKSLLTAEGRSQWKERQENIKSGNAKRKEFAKARSAYNRQRRAHNFDDSKIDEDVLKKYKKAKNDYESSKSQIAQDKNKRYRSVVGNAFSGAVGGAYRGVTTGLQATKLEDIPKKVKEGVKKDRESLQAREKWLDSGGGSEFEKIITDVEKSIGISTESERIAAEIKGYEDQIKGQEAMVKREQAAFGQAKKSADISIDRTKNGKNAHTVSFDTTTDKGITEGNAWLKRVGMGNLDIKDVYKKLNKNEGEEILLKDVYNIANAELNSKKTIADEATKKYQSLSEGPEKEAAKEAMEKALMDAQEASNKEVQVNKKLGEFTVEQILSANEGERRTNKTFDQNTVTAVESALESMNISLSYPETARSVRAALERDKYQIQMSNKSETEKAKEISDIDATISAINNPKAIKTFKVFDSLSKTLNSVADDRKNSTISALEDTKNRIQASAATDAAKANDAASGKK